MLLTMMATTGTMWGQSSYELYSGSLAEGDYIIYYDGRAMKNTVTSSRLDFLEVTPSNNIITPASTNDEAKIVWHIAPSDSTGYWTIYNAAVEKYAASTGAKNKAQLLASDTVNNSLWAVSGSSTYNFENKERKSSNSDPNNKWLRNNTTYGFACYASGTGGALSLYKLVETEDPSISASNVNLAYDATQGSIGYTLNNATGNVTAAITSGDWITSIGTITSSAVPFTCSANTGAQRTATVTLSFEGAQDKVVTVTQGAAPMTIAAAREQGTGSVVTRGVVTSCVGTTGYIQDDTAAICVYGTSLTIGDDIVVSGTLSDYNGLLEITSPQVTVISTGNTVTTTVKTIAEINADDYTASTSIQGLYVTIEEATVNSISDKNVTIAQSTNTIVVRFANTSDITFQANDIITLDGNIGCYNGAQIANPQNVEIQQNEDPYITANDVEITYNATGGSIAYTVENQVQGGQLTAATTSTWLTLSNNFASPIAFTCEANAAGKRTATVTLTYTYGAKTTVNKEVTVTQAANPNVFDNISSITSTDVNYKVKGTVLAVSARAFVLGDGTGYIYYYNGYSAPSVAVNDLKSVNGTMSSYGHVFQFTSAASITAAETSNYNGTPSATVITSIPDYTSGLHLSDYYQFDGTLTKSSGYYYVSCGEGNINISYPSSAQQTAMNALENKNVRVKGYFAGINSSSYFTVILESIEEIVTPTISITPATANPFTYVQGSGPSDDQVFEVAGENLTSEDIVATITTGADYFEITDDEEYSSTVTVNSGDYISIRLKAGLALGNDYPGVLTLTNEGAQNVTMNLSGSVTGTTYDIVVTQPAEGGTIEADKETAEAGTTITLTATPDAAYNFGSWIVEDENENPIEVTGINPATFEMPESDVLVTATFTAKETFAINCVADPTEGGEIEANPASAYEGQTVTLSYDAETGYSLSGIVITKTGDGSATGITPTASGDDFTFTMPGYAVTVTAAFISDTYNGSFAKYISDTIVEGDYILVYNDKAMNNDNSTTSNKLGATTVDTTSHIITDPSRSIVWHIAPIGTDGKWTIYNAYVSKYVNASASNNTNVTLVDNASYSNGAKWSVTIDTINNTYDFSSLTTSRALRYNNSVFGHYATSNGDPLTLYKYTVLIERTITFHGNGGLYQGDETYPQVVYDGIATNLTANQFTKENSAFAGWALTADGDVEYDDEASITVTGGDLDLYAKWETSYTAMVDDQIVGGTVKVNGEDIVEVAAGAEMTLTYTANLGYAFSEWNVYNANEPTTTVEVENNTFIMPEYDVIVSATFIEATTYSLVTNVNQIVSGKHYIIVSGFGNGTAYAMGKQNGNNRKGYAVTIDDGQIAETENVYEFVINTHLNSNDEVDYYTIYDAVTPGYLYASSSGANQLKTTTTLNDNGKWTIEISDTIATITAQGTNTRKLMRYNPNNNSPIFACYATNTTTGNNPCLYVKNNDEDYEYYGMEISYEGISIPDGETITVGAGSVMTVPNDFENDDPAALVIGDGGQLIHQNAVDATLQRSISAYTAKDGDGWYMIASPVDGLSTDVVAQGTYDLFVYNEPTAYWWVASGHGITTFERGQGYLYANAANIDLNYAGTMKGTNDNMDVDLSYTANPDPDHDLKGFNLVGNPFTRNLGTDDITLGGAAVASYYGFNNNGEEIIVLDISTNPIKPGQGFMVQAIAENQKLVFNPGSGAKEESENNGYISILAGNENGMDNAFIHFGNVNTLRKMTFSGDKSQVYVMNNGDDYAAARLDEAKGMVPVHFVAAGEGTYTITIEAKNLDLETLRLIDNFTGEEIDLLVEPTYTFKANSDEPAERFTLLFEKSTLGIDENDVENEVFAYQNGSDIIVNGEGTLQVFDVMGRMVMSREINGNDHINTSMFNTGVYVFRLNGMTQKIVVR